MKVLVTGGCGFIGTHVAIKLKRLGYKVDIVDDFSNGGLDNFSNFKIRNVPRAAVDHWDKNFEDKDKDKDFTIFHCDVAKFGILKRISSGMYDCVFHLAAKPRVGWSIENPLDSTDENLNKSIAVALACVNGKTKFVFSSTSAVYGNVNSLPSDEECNKVPTNPYGLSKYCVEQYLELFSNLYELDWVALRYFNVYGPGQPGDSPYSTAISAWCHCAKNNQQLRSDGDGYQSRDMVFVDDVAAANVSAMNYSGTCRIFNIGTGKSVTNNWTLDKFKSLGYDNVISAPARKGDVLHTLAQVSRAKAVLDWEPKVGIEKGLELTMGWWGLNAKK